MKAGPRLGWRWTDFDNPCEINWVDPEPSKESDEYGKYVQELVALEEDLDVYKGLHQPPTEEEYNRIFSEYQIRHTESWD